MIFNSFEFMFFLPVVWAVFWALNRHSHLQNLWVGAPASQDFVYFQF